MNTFTSKRFIISAAVLLIIFAFFTALPLIWPDGYAITFMSNIYMYIIMTVSWILFSGPTGYISLAVAAFFGIGVYTSAMLGTSLPFPFVVIVAGLLSLFLAVLTGALTLRLKGVYFIMFTYGLLELIRHLVKFLELTITHTRGRMVMPIDPLAVYYYMFMILVTLLLTTYFIMRSKWGLALKSIGQNEEAAAHIGINVTQLKVIVFSISSFFIGTAGAVMATKWTYIDPDIAFNPTFSFMPVLMAVFGGYGQLWGPIIGSAIFTWLEEFLVTKIPELYMIIFGSVFIIANMYMPYGIVGLIQKLVQNWRKRRASVSVAVGE